MSEVKQNTNIDDPSFKSKFFCNWSLEDYFISSCEDGDYPLVVNFFNWLDNFDINLYHKTLDTTGMHIAVCKNDSRLVQLLKHKGGNINATISDGSTPLHVAARLGHLKVLKTLLKFKPNIFLLNIRGDTPLAVAIRENQASIVHELIKFNIKNVPGHQRFYKIVENIVHGNVEAAKRALDRIRDVNLVKTSEKSLFHLAIIANCKPVIDHLLSRISNISGPMLMDAICMGNVEVVKSLLKKKVNIEFTGPAQTGPNGKWEQNVSPLFLASHLNQPEIICLLLKKHGAALTKNPKIFHRVCSRGQLSCVKVFLDFGCNIDWRDDEGNTGLHLAVKHLEVVKLLLEEGAKVHTVNSEGKTCLHVACALGCAETVDQLLLYGADVYARDNMGRTALHHAAMAHKDAGVVQLLLERLFMHVTPDVQVRDNQGNTPMDLIQPDACQYNYALMLYGATSKPCNCCDMQRCPLAMHGRKLTFLEYYHRCLELRVQPDVRSNGDPVENGNYLRELTSLRNVFVSQISNTTLYHLMFKSMEELNAQLADEISQIFLKYGKDFRKAFPFFGHFLNRACKKIQ